MLGHGFLPTISGGLPCYRWGLFVTIWLAFLPNLVLTPWIAAQLDRALKTPRQILLTVAASSLILQLLPLIALGGFATAYDARWNGHPLEIHFRDDLLDAAGPLLVASIAYGLVQVHRHGRKRVLLACLWGLVAATVVHVWVLAQSFGLTLYWYRDIQALRWKVPLAVAIVLATAAWGAVCRLKEVPNLGALSLLTYVLGLTIVIFPFTFPLKWEESDIARINAARLTPQGDLLVAVRRVSAVAGGVLSKSEMPFQGSTGDDAILVRRRADTALVCLTRRPIAGSCSISPDGAWSAITELTSFGFWLFNDVAKSSIASTATGATHAICHFRLPLSCAENLAICRLPDLWGPDNSWANTRDRYMLRGQLTTGKSFETRFDGEGPNDSFWRDGDFFAAWSGAGGRGYRVSGLLRLNPRTGEVFSLPIPEITRAGVFSIGPDGSSVVLGPPGCRPTTPCRGSFYLLDTSGHWTVMATDHDAAVTIVAWPQKGAPFLLERATLVAWMTSEDAAGGGRYTLESTNDLREVEGRFYASAVPRRYVSALLEFDLSAKTGRRLADHVLDTQLLSDSIVFVEDESDVQTVVRYWPKNEWREILLTSSGDKHSS